MPFRRIAPVLAWPKCSIETVAWNFVEGAMAMAVLEIDRKDMVAGDHRSHHPQSHPRRRGLDDRDTDRTPLEIQCAKRAIGGLGSSWDDMDSGDEKHYHVPSPRLSL